MSARQEPSWREHVAQLAADARAAGVTEEMVAQAASALHETGLAVWWELDDDAFAVLLRPLVAGRRAVSLTAEQIGALQAALAWVETQRQLTDVEAQAADALAKAGRR